MTEPDAPIEFGPVTSDQVTRLLELWRASGLHIRPAGREHPDRLRQELEVYPDNYVAAYRGDRMIGVVIASWDGRRGWISRLAVHPDARRTGVAQALIDRAEQELRRRGAQVMAILIEPDNEVSLALFRRQGYRETPRALYLSKRDNLDV